MTQTRKHPKALPFLFFTEMWERFGFYVVQGLLVLYMTKAFGFSDDLSYTIMGAFSALAYIAPFIGGTLADRLFGFKAAILWGGIFLSVGYALLAMVTSLRGFYFSLATIIVGNGLFKPNVSSLLGFLYQPGDPKREAGFTIFYIGINLGALLSGVSSGFIKDHFGWHAGFGLASLGLILGLGIFFYAFKSLSELKQNPLIAGNKIKITTKIAALLGCVITIFLVSFLLQNKFLAQYLLPLAGMILLGFLLLITFKHEADARKKMLSLIVLILSSIVFWMFFLQLFFSANLFIDRLVDRQLFGMTIPTTAFYALESVFIILLGPLFAWSWHTLSASDKNPSAFYKFIVSIAVTGLGFFVLYFGTYFTDSLGKVNPLWVLLSYFLITIGELLLSPIGLSAVTTLAPKHLVGMMMGVWFVATGFGGQFAGWLAQLSSIPESVTGAGEQLVIYRWAFFKFACIGFGVAVGLVLMQGVTGIILRNFMAEKKEILVDA